MGDGAPRSGGPRRAELDRTERPVIERDAATLDLTDDDVVAVDLTDVDVDRGAGPPGPTTGTGYRPRRTLRGKVDAALLETVRLVLDDQWTACGAAMTLRERVDDDAVLRRVQARVAAAPDRPGTTVDHRALLTLRVALTDDLPDPASCAGDPDARCQACRELVRGGSCPQV